jgi:hypothetical protein
LERIDKKGEIIISKKLNSKTYKALGIDKNMKLLKNSRGHQKYLKYHRENIFNKKLNG